MKEVQPLTLLLA